MKSDKATKIATYPKCPARAPMIITEIEKAVDHAYNCKNIATISVADQGNLFDVT
jgi:hypothetical protein